VSLRHKANELSAQDAKCRPASAGEIRESVERPAFDVEVFFDGGCPLCRREIAMLRRLDRHGRIRFTDIAAPEFDAASFGRTQEELMREIKGRLPDGTWIAGVEVFRRLYGAAGFRWLISVTRLPGIRHLLDLGYRMFAKHRLRLTGRCAEACRIDQPVATGMETAHVKG
jgi:predicted DCC family thiol-disulfide oxidoreductase YuxK